MSDKINIGDRVKSVEQVKIFRGNIYKPWLNRLVIYPAGAEGIVTNSSLTNRLIAVHMDGDNDIIGLLLNKISKI